MSCSTKINFLQHLREKGLINDVRKISDLNLFSEANEAYTRYISLKYNIKTDNLLFDIDITGVADPLARNYAKARRETVYRAVPNEQLFKILDSRVNNDMLEMELDTDLDTLFDPGQDEDLIPTNYNNFILLKENRIKRLEDRLKDINQAIKKSSSNKTQLKELLALKEQINQALDGNLDQENKIMGLREELTKLKSQPPIAKLKFYTERDFERMELLIDSQDPKDIAEVREIINFYTNLNPRENAENHPFHTKEEMYDENGKMRPEMKEILPIYDELVEKAQRKKAQLDLKSKQSVLDTINDNSLVKKTYGRELSSTEVFNTQEGLRDMDWVSLFILDPQHGLLSKNSIITQVEFDILNKTVNEEKLHAADIARRVDELQRDLEKELPSLNGWGLKGKDFSLFRAKDANGYFLDSMTQRFTQKMYSDEYAAKKIWKEQQDKIYAIEDETKKKSQSNQLYIKKLNWYRENFEILDIRKIPELMSEFPQFQGHYNTQEADTYKQELIDLLGEVGYQEEIEKQKTKLKEFMVKYELEVENLEAQRNRGDITQKEMDKSLSSFDKKENPFLFIEAYNNFDFIEWYSGSKANGDIVWNNFNFNHKVPRKIKKKVVNNMALTNTEVETGYYDDRFSEIESNPTLKKFHDLLSEVISDIQNNIPTQDRDKYNLWSIPATEKTLIEVISNPELNALSRLTEGIKWFIDKFKRLITQKLQNSLSFAYVDPITGQPGYNINSSFLKSNKQEINNRLEVEIARLKIAMRTSDIKGSHSVTSLPQEAINIIAEALGVEPTAQAINAKFPGKANLDIKAALRRGITHQVVTEQSLDLPKILKVYSDMMATYKARQKVLPILEVMKNEFEKIKQPTSTGTGNVKNVRTGKTRFEGERWRANLQHQSWFDRAVLGNYGSKDELLLAKNVSVSLGNKVKKFYSNKLHTYDEKESVRKINSVIAQLQEDLKTADDEGAERIEKEISRLNTIKDNLGGFLTLSSMMDGIFNFVRLQGLGWNPSSAMTNLAEGQISNIIAAATGDYFPEKYLDEANNIVKGSILRNASFGKISTSEARKASRLMEMYDILQDASNQLQKASSKSAFSSFSKLDPYEIVRRIEYLNQTPIMIAILKDTKILAQEMGEKVKLPAELADSFDKILSGEKTAITRDIKYVNVNEGDIIKMFSGRENVYVRVKSKRPLSEVSFETWKEQSKNDSQELYDDLKEKGYTHYEIERVETGKESSVWDAMTPEGKLKDEFATPENRFNFEVLSAKERQTLLESNPNLDHNKFNEAKSRIIESIVKIHGDYNELRGNMASEYMIGKAFIMFKRWIGSQLFLRFATKQDIIALGVTNFKGRYRSMSKGTGTLQGAAAGFLFAGPVGAAVGGVVGLGWSKFYGGVDQNLSFLGEMAEMGKQVTLKMMGIPVNFIAGKQVIKNDWNKFTEAGYSGRDLKNLKANVAEVAIISWLTALSLFVKALTWDDEDEADDPRRQAHNLLINKLMQISSQATSYMSGMIAFDMIGNVAVYRFFTNIAKTVKEGGDLLAGDDIIPTGQNAGESAFNNQLKKTFLPSPLKGTLGFEPALARQFYPSAFDSWFWGEEKKFKRKTTGIRAEYRNRLRESGLSEEDVQKEVKKKYPNKKRDQTYEDLYKEYEKVKEKEE